MWPTCEVPSILTGVGTIPSSPVSGSAQLETQSPHQNLHPSCPQGHALTLPARKTQQVCLISPILEKKNANFQYCDYILKQTTTIKGVLHPWASFLKTLCIFSKKNVILDKVSYRSGQKCSKELKNYSFTSVEAIVYSKKCAKINILHVLNHKSITTWVSEIPVQLLGSMECYL